jgi:hypothetical protein
MFLYKENDLSTSHDVTGKNFNLVASVTEIFGGISTYSPEKFLYKEYIVE